MIKKIAIILITILQFSFTAHSQEQFSFNNYQVEMYKGELQEPDFNSSPKALKFKSTIINACSEGVNFAGKYTLVINGCGTACQFGLIIDRATGKIYEGFTSELGYKFQENSQLLIKNVEVVNYPEKLRKSETWKMKYLVWVGDEFIQLN